MTTSMSDKSHDMTTITFILSCVVQKKSSQTWSTNNNQSVFNRHKYLHSLLRVVEAVGFLENAPNITGGNTRKPYVSSYEYFHYLTFSWSVVVFPVVDCHGSYHGSPSMALPWHAMDSRERPWCAMAMPWHRQALPWPHHGLCMVSPWMGYDAMAGHASAMTMPCHAMSVHGNAMVNHGNAVYYGMRSALPRHSMVICHGWVAMKLP